MLLCEGKALRRGTRVRVSMPGRTPFAPMQIYDATVLAPVHHSYTKPANAVLSLSLDTQDGPWITKLPLVHVLGGNEPHLFAWW